MDSYDNVYLAGSTLTFGAGSSDMVLVKYDSSGVQQWYHTWGGGKWDDGRGVAVDSSDNVYFAGYTYTFGAGYEDMALVKFGVEPIGDDWIVSGVIGIIITSIILIGLSVLYWQFKRNSQGLVVY